MMEGLCVYLYYFPEETVERRNHISNFDFGPFISRFQEAGTVAKSERLADYPACLW
ncbi:MAG: hypothetical protein JWQ71_1788 [Pedosphaera sp.]|nr:hypothetical protein [Pedosphaera sp.]